MAKRGDVDKLIEAARQPLLLAHVLMTTPCNPERVLNADEKTQAELHLMIALERTQEALELVKDGTTGMWPRGRK